MSEQNSSAEVGGSFQFQNTGGTLGKTRVVGGGPSTPAPAPAPAPTHRRGGEVTRLVYNSETGEMTVSKSAPATSQAVPPTARPFALDPTGSAVDLSLATENSVVTIPGMGDSSVKAWVAAGVLKRASNGQGYELAGEAATAQQQQQQDKKDEPPAINPAVVKNVPPTTEASDAFQKTVRPAVLEQIVSTVAKGAVPDFEQIGAMSGEGEDFASRAGALHGELLASGQAVLRNVGVENPEAFQAWATEHRPDQANDAVRAMLSRDVSKLAALGQEYQAQRSRSIVTKLEAAGVDTLSDHGTVFVSISGIERATGQSLPRRPAGRGDFAQSSDLVTLAEAVRNGWIEIAE